MTIIVSKQQLSDMYYGKRLSMRQIAKELNCSQTTVWKHMTHYELKRRERSDAMKMITKSMEHRQKLADVRRSKGIGIGDKNHAWKGGVGKKVNDRNIAGLVYWKNSVKRRDGFRCQMCGVDGLVECPHCGTKPSLHVHHIKSWIHHPELRLDISNGVTLCEKCHRGLIKITGLIAGTSLKEDNQQPSQRIANRLLEGSTVSPDESIMDTNAPLERDDMTCSIQ
jgi:predicted DNA-binding protein YlxM (UPF0122 family)